MTKHWKRRLEIDVGDRHLVLSDMQVEFQVRQIERPQPGWAYVRITNLSDPTSQSLRVKNASVRINAGYFEGPFGKIFDGNVQDTRWGKLNGTDKYHDILATSGSQAYTFAKVSDTLPKDSTLDDAVRMAAKEMEKMGVEIGYLDPALKSVTVTRAFPMHAPSRNVFDKIAESTNTSWFIFNNQLYFVSNKSGMSGAPRISADTGMIGTPEQQLYGIVVRVLMNPNYKIGQDVQIDAEVEKNFIIGGLQPGEFEKQTAKIPGINPSGKYRIVRIDHDGNTRANQPWYTTLTCLDPGQPGQAAAAPGNVGGALGNRIPRGNPENEEQGGGGG